MYNQKSRKWQLESENAGSGRDVKVTYRMPNELYKAVKLQAIFEGVNACLLYTSNTIATGAIRN